MGRPHDDYYEGLALSNNTQHCPGCEQSARESERLHEELADWRIEHARVESRLFSAEAELAALQQGEPVAWMYAFMMPEGLSEVIPPLIVSKRSINCPKEFKEFPLYPHSTPPGYQLVPIEQGEQLKKMIDSVEQKFPNESRFETALRYIRESAVERKPVVAVKEK